MVEYSILMSQSARRNLLDENTLISVQVDLLIGRVWWVVYQKCLIDLDELVSACSRR